MPPATATKSSKNPRKNPRRDYARDIEPIVELVERTIGYFITCTECGERFRATRNDARYCTDACRAWASQRRRGLVERR